MLLLLLACSSPAPTSTPAETKVEEVAPITLAVEPVRGTELLPADQAMVITHATKGLAALCAKSPRARELQTLLQDNAVPAVALPEGVRVVQAPNVHYPFLLVGDTSVKIVPGSGSFSGAHFRWSPEMPAPLLQLLDLGMTEFGAGIALAHEFVHAEEHFYRNEPVSHYPEPNWITGELVAHSVVHTILNQVTDDRWQHEVVDARVARIEAFLANQGMDPDLSVNGTSEDDAHAIKLLFPGSDNATIGVLLAQADIDTMTQRVGTIAARRNLTNGERSEALITATQGFYEQMGFKEE